MASNVKQAYIKGFLVKLAQNPVCGHNRSPMGNPYYADKPLKEHSALCTSKQLLETASKVPDRPNRNERINEVGTQKGGLVI